MSTRIPSAFLWASAFVLAGLIVVQAGRPAASGPGSPGAAIAATPFPMAEGISRIGDYTLMTFNAGNDDVLAVLDGRGEELFLYRVKNMNTFEFVGRESVSGLFASGKRLGAGKK